MATQNLGKVVILPKGAYDAGTAYAFLDVVTYNGSSYICKAVNGSTGNLPTDTTYWQLIASKGDTGAQGEQGETGQTGATGVGVASVSATKTGTAGNVDTYTMTVTYTDGDTDTVIFTVTNANVVNEESSPLSETDAPSEALVDKLYARKDGDYETLHAGSATSAKVIDAVSDESGVTQDDPFISQGTGTGNNSTSVDVPPVAKHLEKKGHTVVRNQKIKQINSNNFQTNYGQAPVTFSDGICTQTFSQAPGQSYQSGINVYGYYVNFVQGHKYLCSAEIKSSKETQFRFYSDKISYTDSANVVANTFTKIFIIQQAISSGDGNAFLTLAKDATVYEQGDTIQYKDIICVDLTLMFNGNIPQDLLDNPSHFSWYYNGSLAYNVGELADCDGKTLVCTGRNLFTGNSESSPQYIGHYYVQPNASNYRKTPNDSFNCFRVPVIPNRKFILSRSDGNNLVSMGIIRFVDSEYNLISGNESGYSAKYIVFTTPSKCQYIEFSTTLATGDILDVQLYYSPEEGGEGYIENNTPIHYPYEAPKTYDTGDEELLAFDTKDPDGTVHRNTDKVNLGSLEWTYAASWQCFVTTGITNAKRDSRQINAKGYLRTQQGHYSGDTSDDKSISVNSGAHTENTTTIRDTSFGTDAAAFKTAMSGVYLEYELGEPTTEQGTAFSENIEDNDYGMMYWLDEDGNLVGVPQGCKIFYPFDYVLAIDTLLGYTEGDVTDLALKEDIDDTALNQRGYYKMQDLSSSVTLATGVTATLKKAYKHGNVMTMSLVLRNTSGAELASYATLFTLASGMYPVNQYIVAYVEANNLLKRFRINPDGQGGVELALPNNAVVHINISYCVA